jgi:hypothetical protein
MAFIRTKIFAILMMLAAIPATPASAQFIHDPSIKSSGSWAAKPSKEDILAVEPKGLPEGGQSIVRCSLDFDGTLFGCSALSEKPADMGLKAASLKLIDKYRLSEADIRGHIDFVDVAITWPDRFGNCSPLICIAIMPAPPLPAPAGK